MVVNKSKPYLPVYKVDPEIPILLPHDFTYSIQVGDKLFRLSGASLSSDGPSYFTTYFNKEENRGKVLFIDRSSQVFEEIYMHLQGYSIDVKNGYDFLYLYSDACYYGLTKLKQKLLQDNIFVEVGGKSFKVSKELLVGEGNYPNYFSITYNAILKDPTMIMDRVIRPPPIDPPFISARSPKLFSDILDLLQGKRLVIQNEEHREDLINECKYYRFLRLEQQIIKHRIQTNPFTKQEEIVMNLNDLKQSGIRNPIDHTRTEKTPLEGLLRYSRPFVDSNVERTLVMQIESSEVSIFLSQAVKYLSLVCYGKTARKLYNLLSSVGEHLIYEETDAGVKLSCVIQVGNSKTVINGEELERNWQNILMSSQSDGSEDHEPATMVSNPSSEFLEKLKKPHVIEFKILKSLWTVSVTYDGKYYFNALLLEGVTDECQYRQLSSFL